MSRTYKYLFIAVISLVSIGLSQTFAVAQNSQQRARQTRDEIAALPPSSAGAQSPATNSGSSQNNQGQPYSSFYRQASAQTDVYPYPAAGTPRLGSASNSNNALSRDIGQPRLSSQISLGSNTSTGNLGAQSNTSAQAPVYNLRPEANTAIRTAQGSSSRSLFPQQSASVQGSNSRSPVVQQRASTLGPTNLRTPAEPPVQGQPSTTTFRQSVYQQPTLGLQNPQLRFAQNCTCVPVYNPTAAAYQAPSLNPNLGAPPLNIQVPGQLGAQACCQPNHQFQSGIGTPQFGAQGARWWNPFVSGSGVYTPLLRLQNMPVGTYLGQGIIGQPTAYVDGQPIRNLLRYIAP